MDKVTVTCPHCSSTGTYNRSFKTGDGTQPVRCRECKRSFKIHYRKGQVDRVHT